MMGMERNRLSGRSKLKAVQIVGIRAQDLSARACTLALLQLLIIAVSSAAPAVTDHPLPARKDACLEGRWEAYTRASSGPSNNYVNDIGFDPDGTAYLATNDLYPVASHGGGLSVRHPDGRWEQWLAGADGPRSNTIYSVLPGPTGVFVGTMTGLDFFRPPDEPNDSRPHWAHLPTLVVPPFPLQDVTDILRDSQQGLWFTTTFGLFHQQNNAWTRYGTGAETPGMDARFINTLREDDQGRVWVGTYGKGLFVHSPNGTWRAYSVKESGLGSDYIYAIAFDQQQRVWVGTSIGVSLLEAGHWRIFTSRNSPLVNDDVRTILVDRQGRVWLGTHGGISIVDGDVWWQCPGEALTKEVPTEEPPFPAYDTGHAPRTTQNAPRPASIGGSQPSTSDITPASGVHSPPGRLIVHGPQHPQVVSLAEAPDGAIWAGTYGGGVAVFYPAAP